MTKNLFVYGTLLPGSEPAPLRPVVARLQPLGPATVAGVLYDFGPYPGALLVDAVERVYGQVFAVPDDDTIWTALDAYEGFDPRQPEAGLFRRETCLARLDGGGEVACDVYVYNGKAPASPPVAGGRWQPPEMD